MKNIMKLSVICSFLVLEAAQAGAQTLAQNLTIALSGYIQGTNSDNGTNATQTLIATQVNNKTVIQSIGAALGVTFSPKAQIQALLDTSGVLQAVVVNNGGQQTDVTSYFTISDGISVSKSRTNGSTGASSQTGFLIREFAVSISGGLSFDVQGFTTIAASTTAGSGGATTTLVQFTATVSGTGTDGNGNPAVLKGTIVGTKD